MLLQTLLHTFGDSTLLNGVMNIHNSTEHSSIHATPNERQGEVIQNELDHNQQVISNVII